MLYIYIIHKASQIICKHIIFLAHTHIPRECNGERRRQRGRKGGEGGGQKEEDRIWNYLLYICSIICTFVALDEFFNAVLKPWEDWIWQMSEGTKFHCFWSTVRLRVRESALAKRFCSNNMGYTKYPHVFRRMKLPGRSECTHWHSKIGSSSLPIYHILYLTKAAKQFLTN